MKTLRLLPHLSKSQIQNRLRKSNNITEFKRWQCLYLIQTTEKISAGYLSNIMCLSKSSIYNIVQTYNRNGEKTIIPKNKGGRKWSLLSWQKEKKLMKEFAADARQGKLITARLIKKRVEEKVGNEVSDDYLWDLFHRHGWKKKKPKPAHPRQDKKAQEEFKKNSRMIWTPT